MSEKELNEIIDIIARIDVNNETEAIAKEELMSYAEQLQQENKELKKFLCKRNDCAGRLKKNNKLTDSEVLVEFDKWLESQKKELDIVNPFDRCKLLTICEHLNKLQELKEGKK